MFSFCFWFEGGGPCVLPLTCGGFGVNFHNLWLPLQGCNMSHEILFNPSNSEWNLVCFVFFVFFLFVAPTWENDPVWLISLKLETITQLWNPRKTFLIFEGINVKLKHDCYLNILLFYIYYVYIYIYIVRDFTGDPSIVTVTCIFMTSMDW